MRFPEYEFTCERLNCRRYVSIVLLSQLRKIKTPKAQTSHSKALPYGYKTWKNFLDSILGELKNLAPVVQNSKKHLDSSYDRYRGDIKNLNHAKSNMRSSPNCLQTFFRTGFLQTQVFLKACNFFQESFYYCN